MKKPIDVGVELLQLHQLYITEGKKPRYDFPPGERNLNHDEIFKIEQAVWHAPRIGRIATSRKRQDELIAIPRGLIDWLMRQLSGLESSTRFWKEEYQKERDKQVGEKHQ